MLIFTKKREVGILVGGNIDLDLLFQFPQRYMDLSGKIKRNQAFEMQQWWGKAIGVVVGLGKKKPLNRGPKSNRYGQIHDGPDCPC
jgi:hypothetical protein